MKELTCIICPRGCHLTVDDNLNVAGNTCPRGKIYAINELTHPTRTLTSTMKTDSEISPRVSVKSDLPLPKEKIFMAMEEINRVIAKTPIKIGDILIKNILGLDVNIVATKNIDK